MYKFVTFLLCCIIIHMHATESPLLSKNIIDSLRPALSGVISGAASAFVYAPFHYAQNQSAQGLKIDWRKIHHCRRGYIMLASNSIPTIGAQAIALALINKSMNRHNNSQTLNRRQTTIAAMLAGACAAPFTNALQLLTVHKQNTGLPVRTIINNFPHSYKNLTRGMLPTTLQGMLFVTTYTNGLPCIKNKIQHYCSNDSIAFLSSACLSSVLLTITTQPLRVMATKLHADIEQKQYKGLMDVIKQTIQHHGFRGPYAGSMYRTAGNIFALPVINSTQQILNNIKI